MQETAKGHERNTERREKMVWTCLILILEDVLSGLCCRQTSALHPFPAMQHSPEEAFSFHVDEKGRSVLAIALQLWFDALLKGDKISLLKGKGVISEGIMKVSVQEGMLRHSWSSGSSKPLLLLIPGLTICPYEACRYRSFAISPGSHPMKLPEE